MIDVCNIYIKHDICIYLNSILKCISKCHHYIYIYHILTCIKIHNINTFILKLKKNYMNFLETGMVDKLIHLSIISLKINEVNLLLLYKRKEPRKPFWSISKVLHISTYIVIFDRRKH